MTGSNEGPVSASASISSLAQLEGTVVGQMMGQKGQPLTVLPEMAVHPWKIHQFGQNSENQS